MRSPLRSHLTYANVMVTLLAALVVGGGTALAAHLRVRSSDIVNGEVKPVDLAKPTRAINYSEPAIEGATSRRVFSRDGLTLKMKCDDEVTQVRGTLTASGTGTLDSAVSARADAVELPSGGFTGVSDATVQSTIPLDVAPFTASFFESADNTILADGQLIHRAGGRVITFVFHMTVSDGAERCDLRGTLQEA